LPDPADETELNAVCFRCAKDLARRMLEKRFVSAQGAPDLIRSLGAAAAAHCRGREPMGYPALRHAADITGCLIERGRIASREAAEASLAALLAGLDAAARPVPQEKRKAVMAASCELTLKMIESVTLSSQAIPGTLAALASACLDVLEGRAG
jgi:hypothetical protein